MTQRTPTTVDADRACTKRQLQFIDHILTTGESVITSAATLGTQPSNIYRELRKPHVKKELQRRALDHTGVLALYAARKQGELLNAESEHVQAAVAENILDRHLGKPVMRQQIAMQGQIHAVIDLS